MTETKFTVVVVSWNVADQLRHCLASLELERAAGVALEVSVVDNSSKDGSADMVRREFPWVTLIPSPANLGFAKACNLAAKGARGQYLVLLNPDARVVAGFFSDLERAFLHHPKAGVVGGHILNSDGTTQPSVRGFPGTWVLALEELKLLRRFPWLAPRYLKPKFDYTMSQVVDQVMGACCAVPVALWRELQGFDEGFYLWFEEVDFCKRVQALGYQVWYSATLTLTHTQGTSFAQLTLFQRHYLFTQSVVRYAGKHLGGFAKGLLTWLAVPWLFVTMLLDYAGRTTTKK